MRHGSVWLAVAALAASSVVASAPPPQSPSPGDGLTKGDQVAPFEAEGVDGVRRRVDYSKGSATVLLFFQSGCPKCRQMLPIWNRVVDQRPKGIEVYGVMLDQEPPGFFTMIPVSFPVLRAGSNPAERKALADAFKVHGVPLTVRLRRGGLVEDVQTGPVDLVRLGDFFRP
jgi:thiol-disulfide isomerase/thioredoxin